MALGLSVRLFMVDGTPAGLVTAEVMNWTGHLLKGPRSRLPDIVGRPECSRTGIYFLTGNDPDDPDRQRVYIGEGDNVGERLKSHAKDGAKDFWTSVTVVTSKDTNLTKAHVRYLESRLVEQTKAVGRANIANGNEPAAKALPESDRSDMEYFIHQLETVAPLIDLGFLRPVAPAGSNTAGIAAPKSDAVPRFVLRKEGEMLAYAVENGAEFVVLKGSTATTRSNFASNSYQHLRQRLIDHGILRTSGDQLAFEQDYAFASPSAAAAVLLNRNANGRTEWRLFDTGQTLKSWQDAQLLGPAL